MHQALQIPEVLQSILFNFTVVFDLWELQASIAALQRDNRKTLLNCALTCSAFKAPSLGILWKNMNSLDPLLHLLPRDALNHAKEWGLTRALDGHEWTQFKAYASLVRFLVLDCEKPQDIALTFDSDDDQDIILDHILHVTIDDDDDVLDLNNGDNVLAHDSQHHLRSRFSIGFFASLLQSYISSNNGAIIPNLQKFALNVAEPSDFDSCAMVMMSGLVAAKIRVSQNYNRDLVSRTEAFFDAITHSQSRHTIRKIHIRGHFGKGSHIERLFNTYIRTLRSVQGLTSVALPRDLLEHGDTLALLAQQSGLEQLQISRGGLGRKPLRSDGIAFPALHELRMDLLDMQEIIPLCGQDVITDLCTWFRDKTSQTTPFEMYCDTALLIAQRCPRLTRLDITVDWPKEEPDDSQKTIPTALSPILFSCKSLVDVRICIYDSRDTSRLNPNDHDYVALARSWPLLKIFAMDVHTNAQKRSMLASRATLQGVLDAFATHCELDTLVLNANFLWDPDAKAVGDPFLSLSLLGLEEMRITTCHGTRGWWRSLGKGHGEIWDYLRAIVPEAAIRTADGFGPPEPQGVVVPI